MTTNPNKLNPEPLHKERRPLPKTLVIVLTFILAEVALAMAVFFIVIYSGGYNVAATMPHYRSTLWVLSTAMDNSVRQHASGIVVSETFKSPDFPEGYSHYSEMCGICQKCRQSNTAGWESQRNLQGTLTMSPSSAGRQQRQGPRSWNGSPPPWSAATFPPPS